MVTSNVVFIADGFFFSLLKLRKIVVGKGDPIFTAN